MNHYKAIAWELIIAKFKGQISADEEQQLTEWASDPEHRAMLEELNVLWEKIQSRSAGYTPDKEHSWELLTAKIRQFEQKGHKPRSANTVKRHRLYRYAAIACIALIVVFSISHLWDTSVEEAAQTKQVYTCLNGKSKVLLPDGTEVWLHANTVLSYINHSQKRIIEMDGEAYFEVAHDGERPFTVQSGDIQVVVHGTKFNVYSPTNSIEKKISLIEGSVSMITPTENQLMKPGEIAFYNTLSGDLTIRLGDISFEKSWANDYLYLTNRPLGEVCRILSKWYNVTIEVDKELQNKYMYTFTLHNEPLEEIIRVMSRINPMSYHFSEENVLTITTAK